MASTTEVGPGTSRRRATAGRVGFYALLALFLAIVLVPLYYVGLVAFTDGAQIFTTPLDYLPSSWNLGHFSDVLASLPVLRYVVNTAVLSGLSAVVALVLSVFGAYAIARRLIPGGNVVLFVLLASSMLPSATALIPLFLLFRSVGLTNTLHGLLILYTSAVLPLTVWVFVSFLRQIPPELEEAARIDGAGFFRIMRHVVFPLMWPGMATMFLINFITSWNEFFTPLVFAHNESSKVIALGLLEASSIGNYSSYTQNWGNMSVAAVLATIPVFALTLAFQRKITEGITLGGVK